MPQDSKIHVLQAGRAIAALSVVFHHASIESIIDDSILLTISNFGYLGVDFFFVLSGFIIYFTVSSIKNLRKTIKDYAMSRASRIYIPYLPIGIGIALAYTAFPDVSASPRDWGWLTSITLLPSERPTALSVAWTLRHEVIFYFMFGAFYFISVLRSGMIVWIVAILISVRLDLTDQNTVLSPLLSPLNLEFCMGVVAAWIVLQGVRIADWVLALAAIGAFSFWVLLGAERSLSPIFGLGLAFAILLFVQWEREGRVTVPRWLGFLGDASYSIYLVHGVAISIVVRAVMLLFPAADYHIVVVVLAVAGTAAGIAYHLAVERPGLRMVRHRLAHQGPEQTGAAPTTSEGKSQ